MNRKLIWLVSVSVWIAGAAGCSKDSKQRPEGDESRIGLTSESIQSPSRSSATMVDTFGRTNRVDSSTPIPNHLRMIIQYPNQKPTSEWIMALRPEDRPALFMRYSQEKELTNKLSLTMALSFIGDQQVINAFESTLLRTPFSRSLNADEQAVIFFTISGLGILAREHDSALAFLQQSTDPWFWKQQAPWKSDLGDRQNEVLAGRSIGAIAMSGRPELEDILIRVKQNPFVSNLAGGGWRLDSSILEAVFFRDLLKARGFDYFKQIYGTEQIRSEWLRWKDTETGKQWRTWSEQWRQEHPKEAGIVPPQ